MIEIQNTLFGMIPVSSWARVEKSFLDDEGVSDAVLRKVPVIVESITESGGQIILKASVLDKGGYSSRFLTYSRDEITDLNSYLKGPIVCRRVRVR